MESAPLCGVMEISPWLIGRSCQGWMPILSPPLTLLGFKPTTHCSQIVYSNHSAMATPWFKTTVVGNILRWLGPHVALDSSALNYRLHLLLL